MQDYPHSYVVKADALEEGSVKISSEGLETLETNSPPQFGGPDGFWSPESMLVASVANCFILTFRAIARASRFEWDSLDCSVNGILDRDERKTRFTQYHLRVILHVPAGSNEIKARKILDKSNANCLITNSLNGVEFLDATVIITGE
jgi:organic hydroperoxide reductase OsmC/OhrA